jgi:heat shock protein HslJ
MKKIIKISMAMAVVAIVASGCNTMNKGKKEAVVLPQDRENIVKKKDQQIYTPEEIKRGVVKGDWSIETVMGKKAVGEKAPYIKFVPSEKRIYGNNGCNVLNGEYTYNAQDSTIRFSNMATTMMMCGKEGITDYEINTALDATKYYSWRVDNNDYLLTFYNENRQPVMTLLHQNFEFLNGTWRIAKVNDKPIETEGVEMVIDVDEGKIHGNTGCNILNGQLEIDMDQPNSISFCNIATTRMMCPDIEHETALLFALEEATYAKPVSSTEVILYSDQQKPVLTLVRK